MELVNSFEKHRIKNVILFLRTGNDRVVTVTEKSGNVGFPGGKMKESDKTVFNGMKREYEEETGNKLPKINIIHRFVYGNSTAIFVATTVEKISTVLGKRSDNEIRAIHLTKIEDVKKAVNYKGSFNLRPCAIDSTKLLLSYLGF